MKKCNECGKEMEELAAKTPEGVEYSYFKCKSCGDEIVSMNQLHSVAETYRDMEKYKVKLNKWGLSLGLRIPMELVKKYKLKNKKDVTLVDEGKTIIVSP
jgi:DNA-directed RNA polymerase subunit RPC12/RpoP